MTDIRFELTDESKVNLFGVRVYRIRATEDIPRWGVRKGDLGGWVESAELTSGDARVYGNAWVYERWHFIVCGPIGSEGVTATLYRTKNGKHQLVVGCWTGTLGTLSAEVKRRREDWSADDATQELWVAQYKALRALGRATVARWKAVEK